MEVSQLNMSSEVGFTISGETGETVADFASVEEKTEPEQNDKNVFTQQLFNRIEVSSPKVRPGTPYE